MLANPRRVIRNLLIFAVPFLLVITVVMYFAYTQAVDIITDQFTTLKMSLAARISDGIEERFHLLERELVNLADHLEEKGLNKDTYKFLVHRHTLKYSNLFDADILIANGVGAIYFYRKQDPYQQIGHIPPALFRQLQETPRDKTIVFTFQQPGEVPERRTRIFMAVPLYDNQDQFAGAIAISLRAKNLLADLMDIQLEETEIALLDQERTLLYPFDEQTSAIARELALYDSTCLVINPNIEEEDACRTAYRNQAGIEKIAVCHRLKLSNVAWVVTFSTPKQAVTKTIMPFIKRFRIAVALIHLFVFGSLVLAIFYAYRWNLQLNQTNEKLAIEVDQRKSAQASINRQNAFFEKVIESIPHPFYVIDVKDFKIKLANSAARRGRLDPNITCHALLHGQDEPCACQDHPCPIHSVRQSGKHTVVEHLHYDEEGNAQNVEVHGYPAYDEDGNLSEMIVYAQDVTERRLAEKKIEMALKEKEVLIGEIHHRVKNNLQVMYGLLEIQSDYAEKKTYQEIFKNLQNQIMSMALVHEKLYQGDDLANIDMNEYFRRLADVLFMSYGVTNGQIQIDLDVAPVNLSVDTAILCGLIMNELVSNSLKHAFPDGRNGKIKVSLHPAAGNQFLLVVSDNGVGLPEKLEISDSDTFGLQMVQMLMDGRISGNLECLREDGTTFRIHFTDPALAAKQTTRVSDKLSNPA